MWTSAGGDGECNLTIVPTSKHLAIWHAAIYCCMGPNNRVSGVPPTSNPGAANFTHPVLLLSASSPNACMYDASATAFYHADAGKVVKFTGCQTAPDSAPGTCQVSIGGFLVNAN